MECMGLIVCLLTMEFDQSTRPILVIGAKRICGLMLYILVNLMAVDISHPTMQYSLRPGDQLKQKCREHTLGIIKVAQNGQSVKMVFGVVAVAMCKMMHNHIHSKL